MSLFDADDYTVTPEPHPEADALTPRDFFCPDCHARRGSPCKRPSGHRAMDYHAARRQLVAAKAELLRASSLQP